MSNFSINTKIYFGNQSLESYLSSIKSENVFIITDKMMVELGMVTKVEKVLSEKNISYHIYDDILPDPDIATISKGIKAIAEYYPDTIIAVGGGSVIDAGKAIALTLCRIKNLARPLFVAVPTTSGTGSEVTSFSVIKDDSAKLVLIDEWMSPDVAVLDPSLVTTVPPKITADTGLDVLTHCIEAYVSNLENDFTDALAEKGISLVFSHLLRCYVDGSDHFAREKMHNASCIAGMAFTNSSLGINHSLAHAIGGKFKIPHGRANAILLPYVIAFNSDLSGMCNNRAAEKYTAIAKKILECDFDQTRDGVLSLIKAINYLRERTGIPNSFSEYGLDRTEFVRELDRLVQLSLSDACTESNPQKVNSNDLKGIYINAFDGYQF